MNSKILLLSIAVISVGLFAMPSTLSLFAGQHTFDKAGNTTICAKCHSDVLSEINAGAYHKSLISNSTTTNDCRACHTSSTVNSTYIPIGNQSGNATGNYNVGLNIATGNFTTANGSTISYGAVHAAVTVECKACHYAVNFTNDAHKIFADNASTQEWLLGANEACIGCHTKGKVEMTWVRKGGYNYTYDFQNKSGVLSYNGTNVTTNTNNTG